MKEGKERGNQKIVTSPRPNIKPAPQPRVDTKVVIVSNLNYSIPIYENGVKTEWTVDGVIGDEKYLQLIKYGDGKGLPTLINLGLKDNKE